MAATSATSAVFGDPDDTGGRRRLPFRPILISTPSQPAAASASEDPPAAATDAEVAAAVGGGQKPPPLPMDDFDLYCRMAQSPASLGNSSPLHSPASSAIAKVDEWIRSLAGQELDRPDSNLLRVEQPDGGGCRINKYRSKSHRLRRERDPSGPAAGAGQGPAPAATEQLNASAVALDLSAFRPRAGSTSARQAAAAAAAVTAPIATAAGLPEAPETLVRVRSFRRTKRGLVNQGDATVLRGARSSCSVNSSPTSSDQELRLQQLQPSSPPPPQQQQHLLKPVDPRSSRRPSSADRATTQQMLLPPLPPVSPAPPPSPLLPPSSPHAAAGCTRLCRLACRVQVMGAPRVGKTALCTQFLSSESHVLNAAAEEHQDEDVSKEKFVTVLLDGDEYHVTFLDTEGTELGMYIMDVDAYMIVFALDSRRSFATAKQVLNELVSEARKASALVLVGNKSDLVRSKEVTYEEAKNLAAVYGAKYTEVSTALNHQVDELLVGTLAQVRAQQRRMQKEKEKLISLERDGRGLRASLRLRSPRRMVGAFIKKHFSSRSCDNLDKET